MAERIKSIAKPNPSPGPTPIYPWADWTDGAAWRITRGVDFKVSARSMRARIHGHAAAQGLSVRTVIPDENTVEFQFVANGAEAA